MPTFYIFVKFDEYLAKYLQYTSNIYSSDTELEEQTRCVGFAAHAGSAGDSAMRIAA